MMGESDPELLEHGLCVAFSTERIGERAGYGIKVLPFLVAAAALHDWAKTLDAYKIYRSPQRLDENDIAMLKGHPEAGSEMVDFLPRWCREAILYHHHPMEAESGLARNGAEIIQAADNYEALTSKRRPYRAAMEPGDALAKVREIIPLNRYVDYLEQELHREGVL